MKSKSALAVIQILAAASGWGIIGAFSRPLFAAGLSPIQVTFVRSILAVFGIGIFILIKNRRLFYIKLKDFWIFLGTGILSIGFFNICYFMTIENATLATASILLYTAPFFVMLASALIFREKITTQKLAAIVLAFAGCVLVSGFAVGKISPITLITGIGSGIGYASYSIFGKIALKKYNMFTVIFYTFVVSAVALFPFSKTLSSISVLFCSRSAALNALALGVISTIMPYICYTGGLRYIEAGKASVLAFAEPMVASLSGILIFGETLKIENVLGIVFIFLAIIFLNIPLKKNIA